MCDLVPFFMSLVLGFVEPLGSMDLKFLSNLANFPPLFQIYFLFPPLLFFGVSSYGYICLLEVVLQFTDVLFIFFILFSLCDSFWMVSITVSSSSLFFPATSNLPLIVFTVIFISNIVIFITRTLSRAFIFSMSQLNMLSLSTNFLNSWNTITIIVLMCMSSNCIIICVTSESISIDFSLHCG